MGQFLKTGLFASALLFTAGLAAASFNSGSTGADGAFSPSTNVTVDLSAADTGPGTGHYDAAKWAVVFNYTTISIPAGVTVQFKNHPSGAPVVWLATGEVNVSGYVNLDGAPGCGSGIEFTVPGPGGFAGARNPISGIDPGTIGFGPGGSSGSGSYATVGAGSSGPTYGNPAIVPLIGGSGGGHYHSTGGAGGGAILIASSTAISLSLGSVISANGGGSSSYNPYCWGGSGGGIRLVSNSISGPGSLRAAGTGDIPGGDGRIRVEANSIDLLDPGLPAWTYALTPGQVFPDASVPTLAATVIDGQPVSQDPIAGVTSTDVTITDTTTVTIQIAATNIPTGTTVEVVMVPDGGTPSSVMSTPLVGSMALSTATAAASFSPLRRVEMFLRANWGTGSQAVGHIRMR